MREILFRGKSLYGDAWVYGSLIKAGKDYCCILEEDDGSNFDYPYLDADVGTIDGQARPVKPETVGQFTGKLDKNGREIFEGDIVFAKMDYGPGGFYDSMVPIIFNEVLGGYKWQYFDESTIIVVGNIHDTPELLNRKE